MINQVVRLYGVNLTEAEHSDISAYKSFNDFFTRALKPGVRSIDTNARSIISPADGLVSQAGMITADQIFQAKGKTFSAVELLGGDEDRAKPFFDGGFVTIYLSPKDYHRLHMPLSGNLTEMVHIPGCLFSVNSATTNYVPGLFARNERIAAIFETEVGPMALVLVGAIFVSSIETAWHGVVTPPSGSTVRAWKYIPNETVLDKGQEMGRFNMGSTIIVLFGKDKVEWLPELAAGQTLLMGQQIGQFK